MEDLALEICHIPYLDLQYRSQKVKANKIWLF